MKNTPAQHINHYQDKYWNDIPAVREHICQRATGDPKLWWIPYFKKRYAQTPFKQCLIIGCGNGRIEREFFDLEIALTFDAFDCSEKYLKEARESKGDRPIHYFYSTFDAFQPEKTYDLVVNVAALHHVENLNALMEKIATHMPLDGIFVNWDYVGPNRNQYSDHQLKLMEEANSALPKEYRTPHPLRRPVADFVTGDITEAIRSADILPTFKNYFEVVEHRDLGGGIAYQILWNNIDKFLDENEESKIHLTALLEQDSSLTDQRIIPTLFAFFIGRPTSREHKLSNTGQSNYLKRLEEQIVSDRHLIAELEDRISLIDPPHATPNLWQRFSKILKR